ncbi:TIGR02594 family protein [Flavobacterium agricola]|uniref:TIGR02594 family protein n=1 Tax=Flavobacterium agricola TaxID=2870839 RepID=A0ABY6LZW7_9FLAO|nr:TIGR02594 family protein [Flavobacterium agricola]UYW01811.1 TIGR02594 family protein [Flavobacterium agricola]
MNKLEPKYQYLLKESAPAILIETLKEYGVKEVIGSKHNPKVLEYFKSVGWGHIKDDETPWCGALLGYAVIKAGLVPPVTCIQALKWNNWGVRQSVAMLGDVLTFSRAGGGHVGLYVGEDETCYHVLGGNQSNSVCVTRIQKSRLSQIRRTNWKIAQPKNVRVIELGASGLISKNEL